MIRSFADRTTHQVWGRQDAKRLGPDVQRRAQRKLRQLNAAERLADLSIPPGNRLEMLRGERAGQHSIRINDQFRICFRWTPAGPEDVEITDYHGIEGDPPMTEHEPTKAHAPIPPGEILKQDFLDPLRISQYRLAQATGLSPTRIGEIVHGKRRITPETAVRLSRALGLSERYWINIQADFDLETEHDRHQPDIDRVEILI